MKKDRLSVSAATHAARYARRKRPCLWQDITGKGEMRGKVRGGERRGHAQAKKTDAYLS